MALTLGVTCTTFLKATNIEIIIIKKPMPKKSDDTKISFDKSSGSPIIIKSVPKKRKKCATLVTKLIFEIFTPAKTGNI